MGERLLTIEWQQRELPEAADAEPGAWLLVSTSDAADMVATELTDALKLHDAQCTTHVLAAAGRPSGQRRSSCARSSKTAGSAGVVVLTGPKNGNPDEECAVRGGEYVHHLVRIARELPEIPGQSPRLYVVTRNAQTVLADDRANLEQGGLRGLLRVIGAEHPHLRTTHIDVDEQTGRRAGGAPAAGRVGRRRDRLAQRRVVHGAPVPHSAAPRRAANHRRRPRTRRHAPADPHAG